ncbi:hypothetical protein MUU72_14455 [Streptomyces sp. RS10V-4]|uniref:hypothetical protein n=1 Tax=Streptomyces rhizoryzae TaxID=2932493 RepID=UPI002003B6D9|nr:hypothetical protein [Streptomyces rhizoryzae]MCK7624288.1 hypothetical protein [Streptomyces rhizoryzae]
MGSHRAAAAFTLCAGAALAAVSVPAPAAAAPARSGRDRPAVIDCTGIARVRPGNFILACGDGNNVLTSLRWSQWRSGAALGRGTDLVNDCRPYCAAGRFHGYPVRVRFDSPQRRAGHTGQWRYTRVILTYPANRPAGTPRVVTLPLWAGPAGR